MAYKTHTKIMCGHSISAQADIGRFEYMLGYLEDIFRVSHYQRELTGITGEEERQSVFFTPFSALPLPDPEGMEADREAFMAKITERKLRDDEVLGLAAEALAIRNKHMPVVDKRQTRAEYDAQTAERNRAAAEAEAARSAETQGHRVRYADDNSAPVTWGAKQMAILLQLTYDDSDPMTDYIAPHRRYGAPLLLTIVPAGARTEKRARGAVNRYANLAGYSWSWRTENWSMGHGNYLIAHNRTEIARKQATGDPHGHVTQQVIDNIIASLPENVAPSDVADGRTTYGGTKNPPLQYEIIFKTGPGEAMPYRGYAAAHAAVRAPVAAVKQADTVPAGNLVVTPSYHEKRGVDIWLVQITKRVPRDVYNRYAAIAKKFGARYSTYGPPAKHGFVFFEPDKAQEFVAQAS